MADALITFVLPFYNEEDWLGRTLESLARQSDRRFDLRLVDNASTDGSPAIARQAAEMMPDIAVQVLHEARQGKLFALQSGCAGITTPIIATLDADTLYDPGHAARVIEAFARQPDLAAFLSLHADARRTDGAARLSKWVQVLLQSGHCHGGGAGQAFRREALESAGGFDPERWPFVLEDHEIIHEVSRFGPIAYRRDHTFRTSDRRDERAGCSWSVMERLGYKLLPAKAGRWYFHRILAPRFAARGLQTVRLREGAWRNDKDDQAR